MMKKNVAIIWGGYSSEKGVSQKSAEGIYAFIDKNRYNVYKVKIDDESWCAEYQGNEYLIDKNSFGFTVDNTTIKLDFAYITIHGTPGEDGVLQGYFDMLRIPYSNCGVLASALTFNKFVCNNFLKNFDIKIAPSIIVRKNAVYQTDKILQQIGLPLFVKPCAGGSSYGITKVKRAEELQQAINNAFAEASEAMIERFVSGTEVTCGCYRNENGICILPVTEVVTHNEFFDFDAKYNGQVEEITPARISEELTKEIQSETEKIYKLIDAKGIIRVDFIIDENQAVFLLEVNTTPGMTATSFIPQQVAAAGLSMTDVLSEIVEFEYGKQSKQ